MNRLNIAGTALLLAGTVLIGGTLLSVALAATNSANPTVASWIDRGGQPNAGWFGDPS